MKKILTLTVLFAALLVTAISCGKDDPKPAPGKDDPKNPPTQQKVEVTEVKLNKTTLTLEVDATETLTATIATTDATDKKVTWSSSDKTIATVDNNGKVTAVAEGEAIITAKAGDKTATCKVTVTAKEVEVTGVSLNKTTAEIILGEPLQLTATITPANATNKSVTWISSDETIATVDANGEVTAVAEEGTVTITATTHNGITATCTITASIPVTGVIIASGKNHLTNELAGADITAEVYPENATNKNITWSVDDPTVLQLSEMTNTYCRIIGLKEGYATLKATTQDGNKVDECIISVYDHQQLTSFFKSDLKIPTRKISAGTFQMGSPSNTGANSDETQHSVTLTKDFYMSKFETTNSQFAEFLNAKYVGNNGELFGIKLIEADEWGVQYNTTTGEWQAAAGKEHYPVIRVTWDGATEFATWVGGRLPTEAEWEYACRAGTTTPYFWGSTTTGIGNYAWYKENNNSTTHPVGKKQPNGWGLYDMAGNVWEWCSDWYSSSYYSSSPLTNPTGPTSGTNRVLRGGSWNTSTAQNCRSAYRAYNKPTSYYNYNGFRVVFD